MNAESHRDAAVQLLADVNDWQESTSAQQVLTQAAIARALLGLLEIQMAKSEPEVGHTATPNAERACSGCGNELDVDDVWRCEPCRESEE